MQLREMVEMQLREKGKWVKGKALTLATLLLKHGAEPTRLLAPEFDYSGQMVRIPAEAADYMVALLLYVTKRPQGGGRRNRLCMLVFLWPQECPSVRPHVS